MSFRFASLLSGVFFPVSLRFAHMYVGIPVDTAKRVCFPPSLYHEFPLVMSCFCFRSRFFFLVSFSPSSFLLLFFCLFSFKALSFSLVRFFFSLRVTVSVARALTAQTLCCFFFFHCLCVLCCHKTKSREGRGGGEKKRKKLKVLLFLFFRERKREFRCYEWSREAAKKKKEKPRTQACNVWAVFDP